MRVYPLPSPLCGTGAGWDLSPAWRLRSVARPLLHESASEEGENIRRHWARHRITLSARARHLTDSSPASPAAMARPADEAGPHLKTPLRSK